MNIQCTPYILLKNLIFNIHYIEYKHFRIECGHEATNHGDGVAVLCILSIIEYSKNLEETMKMRDFYTAFSFYIYSIYIYIVY